MNYNDWGHKVMKPREEVTMTLSWINHDKPHQWRSRESIRKIIMPRLVISQDHNQRGRTVEVKAILLTTLKTLDDRSLCQNIWKKVTAGWLYKKRPFCCNRMDLANRFRWWKPQNTLMEKHPWIIWLWSKACILRSLGKYGLVMRYQGKLRWVV